MLVSRDGGQVCHVECSYRDQSTQLSSITIDGKLCTTRAMSIIVGEVVLSEMGLGVEERFSYCSPLITIAPSRLALPSEVHCGTEVMGLESPLDISNWVKHRIPGFGKLVGLPISHHEKLCIAHFQRLEKEMIDANLLRRKAIVD